MITQKEQMHKKRLWLVALTTLTITQTTEGRYLKISADLFQLLFVRLQRYLPTKICHKIKELFDKDSDTSPSTAPNSTLREVQLDIIRQALEIREKGDHHNSNMK